MGRSLIKQVQDSFEAIAALGESRHAAKQAGTAQRQIFSHATYTTYLDRCIAAVKWIQAERNPTLRELRAISHADLEAYTRHCERSGQAGGSIRSTISALRKLEAGMRALRWWSSPRPWVPPDLQTSVPRSPARLGFSLADVQDLLMHVGAEARLAIRIALAANLRIHEIVTLRAADIDREHQTLTVRGKGGKLRSVLVRDPTLLAELPNRGNWLFKGTPRSVIRRIQQDITRAREALEIPGPGMNAHAVRALYAELSLREAIDAVEAQLSAPQPHPAEQQMAVAAEFRAIDIEIREAQAMILSGLKTTAPALAMLQQRLTPEQFDALLREEELDRTLANMLIGCAANPAESLDDLPESLIALLLPWALRKHAVPVPPIR